MKKYLIPALALGLVMTSCQSDEPFAPGEGGEKQVTFTLNVPGELGTRAGATDNASDKGGWSNTQGNVSYTLVLSAEGHNQTYKKENVTGNTVTFSPTVVLGREYTVTAYAHFSDKAQENLTSITETKGINDESKDVYFFTTKENVSKPTINFAEGTSYNFDLKRPYAKLRLIAEDYNTSDVNKPITDITKVTVSYNNEVYTVFDAVEGEFNTKATKSYTKDWVANYYEKNVTSGNKTIFADYIPVNGTDVAPFTVTVEYTNGETYTREFNQDIPVRRNALTTLKGNFFTAGAEIKVEVKDAFEGQPENINFVSVSTASQLQDAIENSTGNETITLTEDIDLNELMTRAADPYLVVNKKAIIDLNGKTLSAKSYQTGKNYNMIDINNGELTIKNGYIVYEHKGANMEWNNSTNIFNVTAGGVLNIEKVTAKNLGGSDMGFVAHLNNWGEVTLNVENSTLESNYVAVRVFNSGYDMNNVTIKNSTLKGGNYAFWVHNYTVADFGTQEKADAQKALLNFDIFNGTNTFVGKNDTPIRLGMTNAVYLNANVSTVAGLQPLLAQGLNLTLSNNLTISESEMLIAPYGNKTALIHNGGVFNGNNKTISATIGGDNYAVMTNGGTIKNLTVDNGFRGIMIMYPSQTITLENVVSSGEGVCYALNTGEGDSTQDLIATNCTFNGWSSWSLLKSATFTNCKFGQGAYYTNVYGRLGKPYVNTLFDGCDFCSKFYIDLSSLGANQKVTLKNCTVNGVKITAENWTSLIAPENTCSNGQISIELKNGTYLTADNLADYIIIE